MFFGGEFDFTRSGLAFGNNNVVAFILSFDTTVEVTAVTGEPRNNDTFNISGPTFFSVNNSAGGVLQRGPVTFVAGTRYYFNAGTVGPGDGTFLTGIEFNVVQAVPLPASSLLLLAGIGALYGARRRRRISA